MKTTTKTLFTLLLLHSLGVFAQSTPAIKAVLADAPKPSVKVSFIRANYPVISAEIGGRIADIISTRQFMTNKCHCIHEAEIGPIANTTAGMTAYSLAISAAVNFGAYKLYQHNHKKLAKIALVADISGETVTNIHNELLVKRFGK